MVRWYAERIRRSQGAAGKCSNRADRYRPIRHVEANDKVRRNVATLVDTPAGQEGRPSKSLTFGQAVALIRAARSYGWPVITIGAEAMDKIFANEH